MSTKHSPGGIDKTLFCTDCLQQCFQAAGQKNPDFFLQIGQKIVLFLLVLSPKLYKRTNRSILRTILWSTKTSGRWPKRKFQYLPIKNLSILLYLCCKLTSKFIGRNCRVIVPFNAILLNYPYEVWRRNNTCVSTFLSCRII